MSSKEIKYMSAGRMKVKTIKKYGVAYIAIYLNILSNNINSNICIGERGGHGV